MKKYMSLLLALTLVMSLCLPAFATEDTADSRLNAVTQQVKETLGLDTSAYDNFYGQLNEGALSSTWQLNWSSDSANLVINATEEGKILSLYRYDYKSDDSNSGPSFPEGDIDTARQTAMDFLNRVLDSKTESASLESESGDFLSSDGYYFTGNILLNGVESPFTFSVTVSGADNTVTNFSRDDLTDNYTGDIPSATPAITADQATQLLKTKLSFSLEYVLDDSEDSNTAVLRYLPESGDEYYVDAQTGALVDLTELYNKLDRDGNDTATYGSTAMAEDSGAGGKLTDAEQAGVEKLEGVLSKTELDAKVKAIAPLNLSGYTLSSAEYSVGSEDEDGQTPVTVSLNYAKQTGDTVQTRNVIVDGRTGALENLYGYAYTLSGKSLTNTIDGTKAQSLAEAFLSAYYGEQYAATELYTAIEVAEDDYSASFTYYQKVNGYFYAGNYFYVTVDLTDGSIQSFYYNFDDTIVFDNTDGIVDEATVMDAYLGFYQTNLSYLPVPTAIDFTQPKYEPLRDMGYSYLYTLQLAYTLQNGDGYLEGIDAKTGKAVIRTWTDDTTEVTYDDLEGHWVASMAEKLAAYQVGFEGGSFLPEQTITQVELVDLLVSAYGCNYDISNPDEVDWLYSQAYSMGFLTAGERDETAPVTRAGLAKLLLDAAGYRRVAALEDIYNPGFSDDASIPTEYIGYVALARGFNLVQGDANGCFRPDANATRAEALAMLFRYMSL